MTTVAQEAVPVNEIYERRGEQLTKVAAGIREYREYDCLAKAILLGGINAAQQFFAEHTTFIGFIPESGYVSLTELADSYGVEEKYLYGVLTRRFVSARSELMKPTRAFELSVFPGICGNYTVGQVRGEYVLTANNTKRKIRFLHNDGSPFVDVRVGLALIPMMYYGRKIPADSPAEVILGEINKTPYRNVAEEMRNTTLGTNAEAQRRRDAERNIPILNDGSIVLSQEFFIQTIQMAVKAAVSEALSVTR